jgi:ubiquitin-protein ligase
MHFDTEIFHPNVAEDGEVMINLLHEEWCTASTTSMSKSYCVPYERKKLTDHWRIVLTTVTSILIDPVEPFDCPLLSTERTQLYVNSREVFHSKARFITEKFAV